MFQSMLGDEFASWTIAELENRGLLKRDLSLTELGLAALNHHESLGLTTPPKEIFRIPVFPRQSLPNQTDDSALLEVLTKALEDRPDDLEIWGRILELEFSTMRRVAVGITGDYERAEDLVVRAFSVAYKEQANWQPEGTRYRAWLVSILRRVALTEAREGQLFQRDSYTEQVTGDPEDELSTTFSEYAQLDTAVLNLPDRERLVIVLRYYEDFSFAEIAEILDLSIMQVRFSAFKGQRKLKQKLGNIRKAN